MPGMVASQPTLSNPLRERPASRGHSIPLRIFEQFESRAAI